MIEYRIQKAPDTEELGNFLDKVFNALDPEDQASLIVEEKIQPLKDWFDVDKVEGYLEHGFLIEARTNKHELIGVVLIGKQNPINWPDGHKAEIFVLAVDPSSRGLGIGSTLVKKAEEAVLEIGAKKIILNTHVLLKADHKFYEKLGFSRMGILKDYYANGDAVFYSKSLV